MSRCRRQCPKVFLALAVVLLLALLVASCEHPDEADKPTVTRLQRATQIPVPTTAPVCNDVLCVSLQNVWASDGIPSWKRDSGGIFISLSYSSPAGSELPSDSDAWAVFWRKYIEGQSKRKQFFLYDAAGNKLCREGYYTPDCWSGEQLDMNTYYPACQSKDGPGDIVMQVYIGKDHFARWPDEGEVVRLVLADLPLEQEFHFPSHDSLDQLVAPTRTAWAPLADATATAWPAVMEATHAARETEAMQEATRVIQQLIQGAAATRAAVAVTPGSSGLERHISGDGVFGCSDRAYLDRLAGYLTSGDRQAFQEAWTAARSAGICTMFTNGEVVYVEDTGFFAGLIKVRRRGQTQEYWTFWEAVR